MRSWVFDTNVVVAAHLSPEGLPARLLNEVYAQRMRMSCDARIIAEYESVLSRPKFRFSRAMVMGFINLLDDQDLVQPSPVPGQFPDESDRKFIEAACATAGKILITGNMRHFPQALRGPVTVLSPAKAWDVLNKK